MPANIVLRTDFNSRALRRLASVSKDSAQSRRLLSLAAVLEGHSRCEAARLGGMDRQTLRDWVHRFNVEGPAGLVSHKPGGSSPKLTKTQEAEIAALVDKGPNPDTDSLVRWRRIDLAEIIKDRFDVDLCMQSVSNLLARLGYSYISARPQHPAQEAEVIEAFKKLP